MSGAVEGVGDGEGQSFAGGGAGGDGGGGRDDGGGWLLLFFRSRLRADALMPRRRGGGGGVGADMTAGRWGDRVTMLCFDGAKGSHYVRSMIWCCKGTKAKGGWGSSE